MKYSNIVFILSLAAVFTCFIACGNDDANQSPIPQIELIGMSKDTMQQGAFDNDTLIIAISFVDGDGDLGNDPELPPSTTIKIVDLRTDELQQNYLLPLIPNTGSLSGEMFVTVFTTCCVFPDNIPPCQAPDQYPTNDLELGITLIDRAGNESNQIITPEITLLCSL